ncbi:RNA 2',3'-cyclic phosphodiesterase [Asticcacaulis sp. W401b]|uniref:RNA 2',3'-cyclic phosphodiesterase n=1 Tax=Asticcacaulis sp. W401b TaxID=3388666 RepID=UPI00397059D8
MHRLFIGVEPPRAIKTQLLGLMGGVSGARWQSTAQLHLTLRFVGEVDRHQANAIAEALADLHHPAFALSLAGVGTFERKGQVHTLWAGVTPFEPVHVLHKKVDQGLVRAGVLPETRAFQPHITLARLSGRVGTLSHFLDANEGLTSEPFVVDTVCLYESTLTSEGSVYTVVERYSL